MRRLFVPALVVAFLAVLPDVAHACPVCFDPNEENRWAFLATTIFLSLFPLSIVGGTVAYLKKRVRQIEEEEEWEIRDAEDRD